MGSIRKATTPRVAASGKKSGGRLLTAAGFALKSAGNRSSAAPKHAHQSRRTFIIDIISRDWCNVKIPC